MDINQWCNRAGEREIECTIVGKIYSTSQKPPEKIKLERCEQINHCLSDALNKTDVDKSFMEKLILLKNADNC